MLLHTGARVVYSSQTHIMLLAARAIIGRAPKRALGMAAAAAGGVAARFVPMCAVLARVGPSEDTIRVRVRVRC